MMTSVIAGEKHEGIRLAMYSVIGYASAYKFRKEVGALQLKSKMALAAEIERARIANSIASAVIPADIRMVWEPMTPPLPPPPPTAPTSNK